jgi:hypothetical protein
MAYDRAQGRLPLARLLVGIVALDAAVLLLLRLALWTTSAPWVTFVAAVWAEVEFLLSGLALWGFAGALYDIRQAKRAFAIIGSGELIATTVGGFSLPAMVSVVGVPIRSFARRRPRAPPPGCQHLRAERSGCARGGAPDGPRIAR